MGILTEIAVIIVQIDEKRNVCTNTYEYAMNGVTAEKDNLQEVPMEMLDIWMDSFRKMACIIFRILRRSRGSRIMRL